MTRPRGQDRGQRYQAMVTEQMQAMRALRALYDCRIIRAPIWDNRYSTLCHWGMAMRRYIGANHSKCDYCITPNGYNYAASLDWSKYV